MAEQDSKQSTRPPGEAPSGNGVSRRSFIQTLGVSAATAGALAQEGDATEATRTSASEIPIFGPDPVGVTLNVNGNPLQATVDPATTLLEALRVHLNHTGCKEICARGACGGCSVLLDDKLVASCMLLAVDAVDSKITTIEGIGQDASLDLVQESFIRHDALQCGYCTPGLVIAVKALLAENPRPTLNQIKHGLSGNLCRCGTYTNVFNAVLEASGQAPIEDTGGR